MEKQLTTTPLCRELCIHEPLNHPAHPLRFFFLLFQKLSTGNTSTRWTAGYYWWFTTINILRYLYKPMGGRDTRQWNLFIVFIFAAAWHEMSLQLVAWGLLNCIFIVLDDSIAYVLKWSVPGSNRLSCLNACPPPYRCSSSIEQPLTLNPLCAATG